MWFYLISDLGKNKLCLLGWIQLLPFSSWESGAQWYITGFAFGRGPGSTQHLLQLGMFDKPICCYYKLHLSTKIWSIIMVIFWSPSASPLFAFFSISSELKCRKKCCLQWGSLSKIPGWYFSCCLPDKWINTGIHSRFQFCFSKHYFSDKKDYNIASKTFPVFRSNESY